MAIISRVWVIHAGENVDLSSGVTPFCIASYSLADEGDDDGSENLVNLCLTALAASLDGLCANQNPEDISSTLRITFKERELYKMYISFLVADGERV